MVAQVSGESGVSGWLQGVQTREELPATFLTWADSKMDAPLQYITWFDDDRRVVFLDYGEAGSLKATFKESPFA